MNPRKKGMKRETFKHKRAENECENKKANRRLCCIHLKGSPKNKAQLP